MSRYVLEGGVEDGRVEARIGRVQDCVRPGLAQQADERRAVAGVDLRGGEPVVALPPHDRCRPGGVDVGEGDALEEVPPLGDGRDRSADRPRSDHENLHSGQVPRDR
jgi:hypothetical protein